MVAHKPGLGGASYKLTRVITDPKKAFPDLAGIPL
jgi:hypothetical protein